MGLNKRPLKCSYKGIFFFPCCRALLGLLVVKPVSMVAKLIEHQHIVVLPKMMDSLFGCGYPLPSVIIDICRNCTKIPSFTSPVIINRGRPSYRDKRNFLPCPHFFLTKRKTPTMHVNATFCL